MKATKKVLSILLAVLLLATTMSVSFTASAADFKLTYDANGGINPPSSQTYTKAGEKTISTFRPTREGYTFLGWSTDPYASAPQYQPGGKINVDGRITLYAVWELTPTASYMLIYNANGGVNPPDAQSFANSGTQTISTERPTRDGCTFMGWASAPDNLIIEYYPGNSIEVSGVVRLYAVWRYNEDANGDISLHHHLYEVSLLDYGADYFIDTMHEDRFEQHYGQTIQQYYAGCRFYYCADCYGLFAAHSDGRLEYMKNSGEVFYLAGTGFFNEFPLVDTKESYRLLPDQDSADLQDGDYWFDLDGFYANLQPETLPGRAGAAAWFEADDMATMLSEDNNILLLMHEHHYDQGGKYYGFWLFDLTDPANCYLNAPAYLHQHSAAVSDFHQIPTYDSDALQEGDLWFDLADFVYYTGLTGRFTETELAEFQTATYAINRNGTILRVTVDGVDTDYEANTPLLLYVLEHGYLSNEGFHEIPPTDSNDLADGDYWYDWATATEDLGMLPEEAAEELQFYKFYVSDDGSRLRLVQYGVRIFDITADSDPDNHYPYLRRHINLDGFTQVANGYSDALSVGDYWFDMEGCLADFDPNTTEYNYAEAYAFQSGMTYYVHENGYSWKGYSAYDDEWFDIDPYESGYGIVFAKYMHRVFDLSGYTEIPAEDSDSLAFGDYWFDMNALKEIEFSTADPSSLDYLIAEILYANVKFYLSSDHQTLLFITGANSGTYDVNTSLECAVFLHQHGIPSEPVELVDSASSVSIAAEAGVLPASTALVVVPDAPIANIEIGNGSLENYSYEAYDVSLTFNGDMIQPFGTVTVKLPLPAGCNKDSIVVYYVDDDGSKTDMHATVEGDYAVFTVDHFSKYVVVDTTCLHNGETELHGAHAATCKEDGYTGDTYCLICNNQIATGTVISKDAVAHMPGAAVKENVVEATSEYGGSYDEVVRCTVCGNVISSTHKTTDPLPKSADHNICKWCGKDHNGFFQKIIGFFHSIFATIFGARY